MEDLIDKEGKEEFEAVKNALEGASDYGLEIEVMVFALRSMKSNPKQSISEAVSDGYFEWIK